MKTRAAVCWEIGKPWAIEELELADPAPGEVLVKFEYAGLCHSDDHTITGDFPPNLPVVGGHEGAGVVQAVGAGVTRFAEGDSVFVTATPTCGACVFCLDGRGWLCDANAHVMSGLRPDGSARMHAGDGRGVGAYAQLGTFSQYGLISDTQLVKFGAKITPETAALISCGVITGWGASVKCAEVRTGDTVVVMGAGGVGMSAVQGARNAGAAHIIAVEPVQMKRDAALKFGATHAVEDIQAAQALLSDLTLGVMADAVIITVGVLTGAHVGQADLLTAKGGKIVLTSVARYDEDSVTLPLSAFLLSGKNLVGNVYGRCTRADIARLLDMAATGELDVQSMITTEYSLDDINKGYEDMHAGKNIRGVVRF